VRYEGALSSVALVERLRDERGVLVLAGEHLGMEGYLRVGFGYESESLRAGLARMDGVLDSLAV